MPKEFRFEGAEVYVRPVGKDVVLSAAPLPGADALLDALAASEPGATRQREQPAAQQVRAAIRQRR